MKEKIEQEAEKYADSEIIGSTANHCKRFGFIAGAKFAHNAALSEAIEKIKEKYMTGYEMYPSDYLEILEGLKIKP